jgi:hypothetical protein
MAKRTKATYDARGRMVIRGGFRVSFGGQPYRLTWRRGEATLLSYECPLSGETCWWVMVDGHSVYNSSLENCTTQMNLHNTDPYHFPNYTEVK